MNMKEINSHPLFIRRAELLAKWKEADSQHRTRGISKIEEALEEVNIAIIDAGLLEFLPVSDRVGSILECESAYAGPTAYGHTIGEGCYWRRNGHS